MRLVIISDTHTFHNKVKLPEGDVLIHCGDFTASGGIYSADLFLQWMKGLDYDIKLFIAGNHDLLFDTHTKLTKYHPKKQLLDMYTSDNLIYLEDSEYTYKGIKFYGCPWMPNYCNWAFMLPKDSKELESKINLIPLDIDVVITHGPPKGILSTCIPRSDYPTEGGSTFLWRRIMEVEPRIHCFGHIHEQYGEKIYNHFKKRFVYESEDNCTTFLNASICNALYEPTNQPIVMEI